MDNSKYKKRLIDEKIKKYLETFGAISIEGPKWCGKTWSSLNAAKSAVYLDDEETIKKAQLDLNLILENEKPQLIDEWSLVPSIWDKVRRKCDETTKKGNYILTCSTKLSDNIIKDKIFHSGAGRIASLKMDTMSLFESGDSNGVVSINDLYNNKFKGGNINKVSLDDLATYIIRGGWPSNIETNENNIGLIPKSYLDSVLDYEINFEAKKDKNKMSMLIKSLARNESSIVSMKTIMNDIFETAETEKNVIKSKITINDYINLLNRLHIISNQEAYSHNYRSPQRVGKSVKRHFSDPSLACAALNLNKEKLLKDLNTFGFMFEALVERDLKIYMEYLDGKTCHFRDNVSGLEVDTILEFSDGEYAAVEIKLGMNGIEEATESLLKFKENMNVKPKFMCIIVGCIDFYIKDLENDIYILPLTVLKP